jgi:hypothetical protein
MRLCSRDSFNRFVVTRVVTRFQNSGLLGITQDNRKRMLLAPYRGIYDAR